MFSEPFSVFLGIPLSLIDTVSHLDIAFSSTWPLIASDENLDNDSAEDDGAPDKKSTTPVKSEPREDAYNRRDAATRPLLLALLTAQFVFTAYLVGLLKWVIRNMCPYCLFSGASFSSLFVLSAFVGRAVPRRRPTLTISTVPTVVAVVVSILLIVSWPAHFAAQPPHGPQAPPAIITRSDADAHCH